MYLRFLTGIWQLKSDQVRITIYQIIILLTDGYTHTTVNLQHIQCQHMVLRSNNEIDASFYQYIVTTFLYSEDITSRQDFSYQKSLAYAKFWWGFATIFTCSVKKVHSIKLFGYI